MNINKDWIEKVSTNYAVCGDTAKHMIAQMLQTIGPIPMVLFCPMCGVQHIDKPAVELADGQATVVWDNPPHKSHACQACGCIWRPCDLPTTGVEKIETRGKADNFDASKVRILTRDADAFYEHLKNMPEGEWRQITGRARRDNGVISLNGLRVHPRDLLSGKKATAVVVDEFYGLKVVEDATVPPGEVRFVGGTMKALTSLLDAIRVAMPDAAALLTTEEICKHFHVEPPKS